MEKQSNVFLAAERHTFWEMWEIELTPQRRSRAWTDSDIDFATCEGCRSPWERLQSASTVAGSSDETSAGEESSEDVLELSDGENGGAEQAADSPQAPVMVTMVPVPLLGLPPLCRNKTKASDGKGKSTLLLRNLPSSFDQAELLHFLNRVGMMGIYDFAYLPMDFATGSNLGYAFVNLLSADLALEFKAALEGFNAWPDKACHKVLSVCWSAPYQGLDNLIAHFRNSRVMHGSVPDQYKPVLLKDGCVVPFPRPTKRLRAPC
jgi:hypothetical protein